MRKLILALGLLLFPALAQAQTCVQADLSAPLAVKLTWQDNATNETSQLIERKLNNGAYQVLTSTIAANVVTFTDSTVVRAAIPNTYTFRNAAVNQAGQSGYSNEACITYAPAVPPAAPSGLTLSALSSSQIQASWHNNSTDVIQLHLVTQGFSPPRTINSYPIATAASYTVGGLQKNKTYCGKISAVWELGETAFSPESCATTGR